MTYKAERMANTRVEEFAELKLKTASWTYMSALCLNNTQLAVEYPVSYALNYDRLMAV